MHSSCGTPQTKTLPQYPSSVPAASPRIIKPCKHILLVWTRNITQNSNRCTPQSSSDNLTISPNCKRIWAFGSKMAAIRFTKSNFSLKTRWRWRGYNTLQRIYIYRPRCLRSLPLLRRRGGPILGNNLSRKKGPMEEKVKVKALHVPIFRTLFREKLHLSTSQEACLRYTVFIWEGGEVLLMTDWFYIHM